MLGICFPLNRSPGSRIFRVAVGNVFPIPQNPHMNSCRFEPAELTHPTDLSYL